MDTKSGCRCTVRADAGEAMLGLISTAGVIPVIQGDARIIVSQRAPVGETPILSIDGLTLGAPVEWRRDRVFDGLAIGGVANPGTDY